MPRLTTLFFSLTLILLLSANTSAAEPPTLAGIYSDLTVNQESGDLVGLELLLIPTAKKGHYQVVVQMSEGETPMVALTTIQVASGAFALSFTPGGADKPIAMSCKVAVNEISCSGAAITEKLKRGKSYWQ